MSELTGKVALVTGAASGVGEASARALAAAGARVVVAALHEAGAKAVAESIAETGVETLAVAFDTSDEAQVAAGVEAAVGAFGGIDILHNNAAITSVEFMMRDGMIHDLDVELWDQTMAVNARGYMLCTKHVLPHMLARGGGVIVNTASGAGLQAEVVRSAYGTSKAAVIGFTRNVATQYGKLGVRCVAVVPGLIMTPTVAANMPKPMIEMMKRHHLTREIAGPQDIANLVAFLASDRAAFITGIAIPVDGGFSIHSPSYSDEMAMFAAASGAESPAIAARYRQVLAARGASTLSVDDVALLEDLFPDYALWHGAGQDTADGAHGRDDLVELWNEVARGDGPAVQVEVADVYADGKHVVGILEFSAGAGDERRTVRQANIFHLDGEGKASELWRLPSDTAISQSFATGEPIPEHPNVANFRAAEEARARNSFDTEDLGLIERFLRDDVHWRSPWGEGPSSREQVVQQFEMFKQSTGGTLQLTLNEVFADDTHALSLVRLTADRPDKPDRHMDVKEANVFHLDTAGRAYEFWGVADDQTEINRFWAE